MKNIIFALILLVPWHTARGQSAEEIVTEYRHQVARGAVGRQPITPRMQQILREIEARPFRSLVSKAQGLN